MSNFQIRRPITTSNYTKKAMPVKRRNIYQTTDFLSRRQLKSFNSLNELKNPENSIYNEPEYYDFQMRALKVEISKIEEEIIPLREKYEKLTISDSTFPASPKYTASPRSTTSSSFDESPRIDLSSLLKQSQIVLKEVIAEQAQKRRIYSELNQLRLEDEVDEYNSELLRVNCDLETQQAKLNEITKKVENIRNSNYAKLIIDQDNVIENLENQLDELEGMESELMAQYNEKSDKTILFIEVNGKTDMLKRKLASLKYKSANAKMELTKKKNYYNQKILRLNDLIESKLKTQKEIEKRKAFSSSYKLSQSDII